MRIRSIFVLWLLAAGANSMTAEELVAKHLEAIGGVDKVRALESYQMEGKIVMGGGFELSFKRMAKRGNKLRDEMSMQGLTGIQSYDGKEAWSVMPFGGRKDPDRMSAEMAKPLIDQADLDGPLVDWQAKGHKLRYLGTEDVDGTLAHKLEVVQSNGDVKTLFFDSDYFMLIQELTRRTMRGAEFETLTELGDYEKVGGVYQAFSMAMGQRGTEPFQTIVIEKAQANIELDDAMFAFPETAKAK